ncbi:MAG: hypothetical protein ACHQDD_10550 [Steroidobacterales bacterium]
MPSLPASAAAAEAMVPVPPPEELLDELELEELLEPLEVLEPMELPPEELEGLPEELLLALLPGFDCATLADEVPEAGMLLALSTATPPQALRLRQIVAAAATSSGEDQGSRIRPWLSF